MSVVDGPGPCTLIRVCMLQLATHLSNDQSTRFQVITVSELI